MCHTTQENTARLKAYKANLVLFPRRSRKPKAGDAPAEELGVAGKQQHAGALMPITRIARELETVEITDEMRVRRARAVGLCGAADECVCASTRP